jgi:hypothetical protein
MSTASPRKYYVLEDAIDIDGRWFLDGLYDSSGTQFDSRALRYGEYVDTGPPFVLPKSANGTPAIVTPPLKVSRRRDGVALDFTFADFDMPVVSIRVADILSRIAGRNIQRFPVVVDGEEGRYEIINVVPRVPCIDTVRSEIQWFQPGNKVRPDLAGAPEMITRLVIDPQRAEGHHIFRPDGWKVVIIVSDIVKQALDEALVSGVTFNRV